MKQFIKVLKDKKGFDFLTDYNQYSELSKDELRDIAKELIYAIENTGLLQSEITEIYETAEEYLTERYDYEFENEIEFVDNRKNAILGIGDDYGYDEYDLKE